MYGPILIELDFLGFNFLIVALDYAKDSILDFLVMESILLGTFRLSQFYVVIFLY